MAVDLDLGSQPFAKDSVKSQALPASAVGHVLGAALRCDVVGQMDNIRLQAGPARARASVLIIHGVPAYAA